VATPGAVRVITQDIAVTEATIAPGIAFPLLVRRV
jgi:hypothetical protein